MASHMFMLVQRWMNLLNMFNIIEKSKYNKNLLEPFELRNHCCDK